MGGAAYSVHSKASAHFSMALWQTCCMSDGQTLHLLQVLEVEPKAEEHQPENGDHVSCSYPFLTQLLLAAVCPKMGKQFGETCGMLLAWLEAFREVDCETTLRYYVSMYYVNYKSK